MYFDSMQDFDSNTSPSNGLSMDDLFGNPALMGIMGGIGGLAASNQVSRMPIPKGRGLAGLIGGVMGGADFAQQYNQRQQQTAGEGISNADKLFRLNSIRDAYGLPAISANDAMRGKGGNFSWS